MSIFDAFTKKKDDDPSGCMPEVTVKWDCCKCVTVTSTKDLSNVVLDLGDTYFKYDNLSGYTKTYCNNKDINGVWVKSGCNKNEDENHSCPEGNGCGEYFSNPNYPKCDCGGPEPMKKLGDKVVLTWGSNKCRGENSALEMTGDAVNTEGYAIPFKSQIKALTATWNDLGCGNYNEVLIVQVNGEDTDAILEVRDDNNSTKACVVLETPIELNECDTINIVSRSIDNMCWEQTCNLAVTVWLATSCDCTEDPIPEGDGIIEVLDTLGDADISTTWGVRKLDTVRNNTMPSYASFDDAGEFISLKQGVYKIWYGCGISTEKSINLVFEVQLQVDEGTGWVNIPYSGNKDHDLSGDIGSLSANRSITYLVPVGKEYKFRIIEKISDDTSLQATESGAGFIAERIADGRAL